MSILSIHIDESGNLNLSNKQNTEYRITLVFHNQAEDISSAIVFLDNKLRWIGLDVPFIHTMPLIRQDKPFENLLREERQRIFNTFASFVATIPITYTSFSAVKSFYSAVPQMQIAFEHQIMDFIRHHWIISRVLKRLSSIMIGVRPSSARYCKTLLQRH